MDLSSETQPKPCALQPESVDRHADRELKRPLCLRLAPELLAAGLLAFMLFWQLGHYALWADEGETALYARNILRFGLPVGYDGRNLYDYGIGFELDQRFVNVFSPWMQFYVTAGAFWLLGQSELTARLPFALLGILGAGCAYGFARQFYRDRRIAVLSLLLMATNVQFILFMRQCRYYAITVPLTMGFLWLYERSDGRWRHLVLAGLLYLLYYFTNPMVGLTALAAIFVVLVLWTDRSKALRFALIPALAVLPIAGLCTAWLRSHGAPAAPGLLSNIHPMNFLRIFFLHFKDFNLAGVLPVCVVAAVVVTTLMRFSRRVRPSALTMHVRQDAQLLAMVVLFTLFLSMLSAQDCHEMHAEIRYTTAMMPLMAILVASVLTKALSLSRYLGVALIAVAIGTNLFALDASNYYLAEMMRERLDPFPNSTKVAVEYLRANVQQDQTILVCPTHMNSSMQYYFSDKLLFCGTLPPANTTILPHHPELPHRIYSTSERPDWVVEFNGGWPKFEHALTEPLLRNVLPEHYELARVRSYGRDLSRPEVFWRTFRPIELFRRTHMLAIYRRKP